MHLPELDAEEIAQDTLMKVHSKIGTFRKAGSARLTTWIFQIAHNLTISFYRVTSEDLEEFTDKTERVDLSGALAGRNTVYLEWLKDELEKLPPDDRQILLWREQDYTHAEIGGWLGMKKGTVRVRYMRAKRKLDIAASQSEFLRVAPALDIEESGGEHE